MSWTVIRPIGARVLVKLLPRQAAWGMLEIPDYWRRQPEAARVLAVGPRAVLGVAVGDIVWTGKFNGCALESPANDPHAEHGTYRMLDGDYEKRGAKLPVRNQGYTHLPHLPDLYGLIELEEGDTEESVVADIASNMPQQRRSA